MALLEQGLLAQVERTVVGLGYELVDVERAGAGLVRVTIEREGYVPRADEWSEGGVTVDDCERVSHQLTHLFTVENLAYERLEVGSPGVDRPLRKVKDFLRFKGALAKVTLHAAVEGQRRLTGRIVEVESESELVVVEVLDASELPEAQKALPRSPSKRTTRKVVNPVRKRVGFTVQNVEKARLVPELNFRSGRT